MTTPFYGTLVDAAAYHTERGNAAWGAAANDTIRTQALINASEYIDSFAKQFAGKPTGGRTQIRYWPATGVYLDGEELDDTIVPREIEAATYEAALLLVQGIDLRPNLDRGGAVKRERVKAGPAEVETEYADSASTGTTYRKINDLISVLFEEAFGVAELDVLRV